MRNTYITGLLVLGTLAHLGHTTPETPQLSITPTTVSSTTSSSNEPNIGCIMGRCGTQALRCQTAFDGSCRNLLSCMKQCDTLPPGDDAEMCTIQCTFKYDHSPLVQRLLKCIADNKCMKPPKESGPACPLPNNTVKSFDVNVFDGEWWVVRGLSKTYDCWKCQSMHFKHLPRQDALTLDYKYTFTVQDGLVKTVPCTIHQAPERDGHVKVDYLVSNAFAGTDHWNVLDVSKDGKYVLIYYCGGNAGIPGVEYQGAIVMARDRTQAVPKNVLKRFESALALSNTGVELKNFCYNDNAQC